MFPRRSFFKIIIHLAAGMMVGLSPVAAIIRRAYAQSKRVILRLPAEDHYGTQWVKYVHSVERLRVAS